VNGQNQTSRVRENRGKEKRGKQTKEIEKKVGVKKRTIACIRKMIAGKRRLGWKKRKGRTKALCELGEGAGANLRRKFYDLGQGRRRRSLLEKSGYS